MGCIGRSDYASLCGRVEQRGDCINPGLFVLGDSQRAGLSVNDDFTVAQIEGPSLKGDGFLLLFLHLLGNLPSLKSFRF